LLAAGIRCHLAQQAGDAARVLHQAVGIKGASARATGVAPVTLSLVDTEVEPETPHRFARGAAAHLHALGLAGIDATDDLLTGKQAVVRHGHAAAEGRSAGDAGQLHGLGFDVAVAVAIDQAPQAQQRSGRVVIAKLVALDFLLALARQGDIAQGAADKADAHIARAAALDTAAVATPQETATLVAAQSGGQLAVVIQAAGSHIERGLAAAFIGIDLHHQHIVLHIDGKTPAGAAVDFIGDDPGATLRHVGMGHPGKGHGGPGNRVFEFEHVALLMGCAAAAAR